MWAWLVAKFEWKIIILYWNRDPIMVTLWEWWQWENVFVKRRTSTLAWSSDGTCPMEWVPSVPPSSRKPPPLGTLLGHRYHSWRALRWEFLKTVAHRTFSNFKFLSFVRFLQFWLFLFWGYRGSAIRVTIAKVCSMTFLPIDYVPQLKYDWFFWARLLSYDASYPRAVLWSRFS